MNKVEYLLKKLEYSQYKLNLFANAYKEPLIINRIKKFFYSPLKVIIVTFFKLGLIKKSDFKTKLFWGREIILPLWDENMLIAYYSGSFGAAEIRLVRYIIKNLSSTDVFYDIGSSFGLYTYIAEDLGARVYSFEPNPHTVKYIKINSNNKTKVEPIAVSDTVGNIQFYDTFASNKSGMSSIFPDIAVGTVTGEYKAISVQSVTLDEYIQNNEPPTFIKMDVMNSDHLVIKGSEKLLNNISPIIALRMYNTEMAIERTNKSLELLYSYGYSSYKLDVDGNLILTSIEVKKLPFASTFIFKK